MNTSESIIKLLKQWIRKYIRMGYSPKLLLEIVFNTIDKELESGEKKIVLYCGSYGGYDYSDEFLDYMKKYHNVEILQNNREIYHYIQQFAEFLKITIPEALQRASGKYCKLQVKEVPKYREYTIHEYDGNEYIEILNDFVN